MKQADANNGDDLPDIIGVVMEMGKVPDSEGDDREHAPSPPPAVAAHDCRRIWKN